MFFGMERELEEARSTSELCTSCEDASGAFEVSDTAAAIVIVYYKCVVYFIVVRCGVSVETMICKCLLMLLCFVIDL